MLVLAACTGGVAPTTTLETGSTTTTAPAIASSTPPSDSTTSPPPTRVPVEPADVVLYNGSIVTMDDAFTIAESVAIRDGTVVAVGASDEVLAYVGGATTSVDLEGRVLMPGFVDPHTHLLQDPAPDVAAMRIAQELMLAGGTTTAGTPSIEPDELAAYQAMDAAGELAVRSHLYVLYNTVCGGREFGDFYLENEFSRDPDLNLAVAGVKVFTDGGACNAPAMSLEYLATAPDYLKEVGWTGQGTLYVDAAEVASVVSAVDAAGGMTVIHAIGDRGISTALAGLADALDGQPSANRHRIDYNSMSTLLTPAELATYGAIDMIPVVMLMPWGSACDEGVAELWQAILPERAVNSIEDRRAIQSANPGIRLSWHGDFPSLPHLPFQQMFSVVAGGAVHVDTWEPCHPTAWDWFPTVPLEEALRMMTINAAAAMGIEEKVGSIQVSKVADLLVLANDLFDPDPEIAIATNYPLVTMIDGVVQYCTGDLCERLTGAAASPVPTTEAPPLHAGWTPVDHPVVDAVRASREFEPASLAVDQDRDTAWIAGEGPPQWIELDLGSSDRVESIRLLVSQDPAGFTVHQIYAGPSPDPTKLVAEIKGETVSGQWLEIDLGVEAQFIRILTPDTPSWAAWFEIEILLSS